jgi:hypothetical protein
VGFAHLLALLRERGHMQAILDRLRAEFLEMPGLRLTAEQVHRFCGVEQKTCRAVLDALVSEKFLCTKSDGTYTRLTEGDLLGPRPANADPDRGRELHRQAS